MSNSFNNFQSNGVEGSHVVVATGVNGKGIVAMGGVVADMEGPVR